MQTKHNSALSIIILMYLETLANNFKTCIELNNSKVSLLF